ncbi:MAG TPA: hypothetical protein VJZ77_18025 [Blastocatellia bacterium]|nr:hypothetical protein [Blastocatellia bacterium]
MCTESITTGDTGITGIRKWKVYVVEFLKKKGADYTVGYDNRWLAAAFLKGTEDETGAPPIPQIFVLSREGRVIEHLIGDSPPRDADYLERVIIDNLNGAPK